MIRSCKLPVFGLVVLIGIALAAAAPSPPAAPAASTRAATTRKAPTDTSATLVSLHYKDADAGLVLMDLFKQIDFPYETHPDGAGNWPHVSIDAEQESYWQVVSKFNECIPSTFHERRNGKVAVNRYNDVYNPEVGVRCISGACLLIATVVHNNVRLTDAENPHECGVDIMFLIEPHIHVATFDTRCQPDVAVDENGKSLLCDPAPAPAAKAPALDTYMQPQIVLNPPADAGHRIALLKGTYHYTVVDEVLVIEIAAADFAGTTTADLDGAKIVVGPMRTYSQQFNMGMKITQEGQTREQWGQTNDLLDASTIALLDDHDFPLFSSGGGGGRGTRDRVISGSFKQDEGFGDGQYRAGPPAKCRITIPKSLRDVPVPYEFKNLPLP